MEGNNLLVERRTELTNIKGKGIEIVSKNMKAGSYKSSMNYKFKLLKNGDIRAFD